MMCLRPSVTFDRHQISFYRPGKSRPLVLDLGAPFTASSVIGVQDLDHILKWLDERGATAQDLRSVHEFITNP